jgi:hypothetical protein
MTDFLSQQTSLFSQRIVEKEQERIFAQTACMSPEIRQLIGLLEGVKKIKPQYSAKINKVMPLLEMMGKTSWQRTEVTDLGFKAGKDDSNQIDDTDIEEENFTADDAE